MLACRDECSGDYAKRCAEILRRGSGLYLAALFLRVVAVAVQRAQSGKNRCRSNSHSTRMTVGRYVSHRSRLADLFMEAVASESLKE